MSKKKKLLTLTEQNVQTRISLEEGYDKFRKHNKVKNLSQSTVSFYDICFRLFNRYYDNDIDKIDREVIDDYILHLRADDSVNDISIQSYIRGLRAFLYYMVDNGHIDRFTINIPKAEESIKDTYTDTELNILLKKPRLKDTTFAGYRNWVIINFLLATGCRASTLCNVKVRDLDFDGGFIKFTTTKNKQATVIPLSIELNKVLTEYLKFYKPETDDYLFPTVYGTKMSIYTLTSAVKKYNIKRGLSKTSIHAYRHTFAKTWVVNGGDIFRLQKILGHKSLEMVRRYVNLYGQDLKKDYDKYNPLAQFSKSRGKHLKLNK
ncbi:tyrosine-type recombinase/integrase [Proteinivorax hydrogeniformans]|uniref:Tyrosine-type recombinase/integrase n=1 Tax=Proteinivorax hydrogeniformans TaxID=1826727 RepID=A0AAU8HRJ9_9FIRM